MIPPVSAYMSVGESSGFSRDDLELLGDLVVKAIKEEIRRSLSMGEPLPGGRDFISSFSYRVTDEGVCVYSTWEGVEGLEDGVKQFPMPWLKSRKGKPMVVPISTPDGKMVFRTAPGAGERPWTHPGMGGHGFIERASRKAQDRFVKITSRR